MHKTENPLPREANRIKEVTELSPGPQASQHFEVREMRRNHQGRLRRSISEERGESRKKWRINPKPSEDRRPCSAVSDAADKYVNVGLAVRSF